MLTYIKCLEPSLALMRHSISVVVISLGEHVVGRLTQCAVPWTFLEL